MLIKKTALLILLLATTAFAETKTEGNAEVPLDASSESNGESERVGVLHSQQLKQLALSQEVKPNEIVWLKVQYPEKDEPVNVLALQQKPRIAQAQGAVLILHDKEQHADWPYFIRPLRMTLPDSGWRTLSITLPYEDAQIFPERSIGVKSSDQIILTDQISSALQIPATRKELVDKPSELSDDDTSKEEVLTSDVPEEEVQAQQADENVDIDLADKNKTKEVLLSYTDRALLHTGAAIDYLKGEGYENIIIVGYRAGADLALDHIKPNVSQIPNRGFALVMVDPILKSEYQTGIAEFFGEKFQPPILDIVNGAKLHNRELGLERSVGARVAEIANYYQVNLTANQNGGFQQSLIRRIRFWLEKYAPGMTATKVPSQP
jgi:hypothetical protein